ncbi:uncharacterized mitochondrial protein AtMg00810-like [Telopea speciosissima]|uniref:uncharacterized mitochondrial protein AtMg00810-like n=1 Tax=Telopea speciosissima TaxID=54955 RepID=UPI001CC44BC4|nr:uncharacterized mitochondrial protein AtMg00810-like [Telopea speciosissima]
MEQLQRPRKAFVSSFSASDTAMIDSLMHQLSGEFSIKDIGPLYFFLGIEVVKNSRGIVLTQSRYICDLLKRTGMVDCKSIKTPMATTGKPSDSGGALMSDPTKYWSVVRALQYVTLGPMSVSQSTGHAFSDADWAGNSADRKSTGGFAIFLGPNLISWTSRNQRTVARSSTEAEYKALVDASAELIWLESLMRELGYPLAGQYEKCETAKSMWDLVRLDYGGISMTKLRSMTKFRSMTLKFEMYRKDPKHTMVEYLRVIKDMIQQLDDTGKHLTDEQQVQAIIRTLLDFWGQIKIVLTHNDTVKTFNDIAAHVE